VFVYGDIFWAFSSSDGQLVHLTLFGCHIFEVPVLQSKLGALVLAYAVSTMVRVVWTPGAQDFQV
jgi:hypothetical protein